MNVYIYISDASIKMNQQKVTDIIYKSLKNLIIMLSIIMLSIILYYL